MTDPQTDLHNAFALHQAGRLAEAEPIYRRVLSVVPDHPWTLHLLGVLLHQRGRSDDGANLIRRAIAIEPRNASFHNNLGEALRGSYKLLEAKSAYERALQLKPDYPEALNNLGGVFGQMNQLDQAAACLRRSIALQPDDPEPHWNLSMALLLAGQWEQGWREFDWRLRRPETPGLLFPQRVWDGRPLAGKTLLLWGEQGFGDMLQFFRYVSSIRNLDRDSGKKSSIIVYVHQELAPLLAMQNIADQVLPSGAPLPGFDVHAALMSCPKIMGTTVDTVPASTSYLTAPADRAAYWKTRLQSVSPRKIGIAWAGRPTHPNDRRRSMSADQLAPLAAANNVTFVTVQPRDHAIAPPPGLNVLDLGPELRDFADTAGLISQLDLLITVDTSVAHLAGALGKPVWLLLPFAPDWRWLLRRDDTPWYPTMRLFRQPRSGGWNAVIEHVVKDLEFDASPARNGGDQIA